MLASFTFGATACFQNNATVLAYTLLSKDTYAVSANISTNLEELVITAEFNGKAVTSILENAGEN